MDLGEVQQREEEEEEKEREATKRTEGRKKHQAWNVDKSSKLGNNPRRARKALRESLSKVSTSPRARRKTSKHYTCWCHVT